jgi:hypothetical protein
MSTKTISNTNRLIPTAGLAAAAARSRAAQGTCAYPWQGVTRAGAPMAPVTVLVDSKIHFRWPGDPSS